MSTTFKLTTISGPTYDCECCGSYSASGIDVFVDDILVWHTYADGHLHGNQTENSLCDCLLEAWNNKCINTIEVNYTEKGRLTWNKNYLGNSIARTPESWSHYKKEMLGMHEDTMSQLREDCQNLPYKELLQLKMVALWIESHFGDVIAVTQDHYYESE